MTEDLTRKSKFLSYVLRHAPESIGLTLDENGWTAVDELLAKAGAAGKPLDEATLKQIVATSDKKRFTLSEDGKRIRAAQGHSVEVALGLEPVVEFRIERIHMTLEQLEGPAGDHVLTAHDLVDDRVGVGDGDFCLCHGVLP